MPVTRPRRGKRISYRNDLRKLSPLTDAIWLLMGEPAGRDPDGDSLLRNHGDVWRFWNASRDELLTEHIDRMPGTRPRVWWMFDKPEPRQQFGPCQRICDSWIQTHFEDEETEETKPCKFGDVIGTDWTLESQPFFLDRLDLFLPGERDKLLLLDADATEVIDGRSDFYLSAFLEMHTAEDG